MTTAEFGYARIVEAFDKDETAGSFLREDGEGGFASGVYRMAREIKRLRADAGILLAILDFSQEATDETLEAEDAAMVEQIRKTLGSVSEPQEAEDGDSN